MAGVVAERAAVRRQPPAMAESRNEAVQRAEPGGLGAHAATSSPAMRACVFSSASARPRGRPAGRCRAPSRTQPPAALAQRPRPSGGARACGRSASTARQPSRSCQSVGSFGLGGQLRVPGERRGRADDDLDLAIGGDDGRQLVLVAADQGQLRTIGVLDGDRRCGRRRRPWPRGGWDGRRSPHVLALVGLEPGECWPAGHVHPDFETGRQDRALRDLLPARPWA